MKQVSVLKIYALSIFLLGTFFQVMGQSKLVNGTVLDEKKNPISGATVTIKGTKTSPNTDIKGGGTIRGQLVKIYHSLSEIQFSFYVVNSIQ